MKDLELARMMLSLARQDHTALEGMENTEVFSNAIFGFHVQQATEKSLKAWLSCLGLDYPKSHDLRFLFQMLKSNDAEISPFYDLIEFNIFAVQLRYEALSEADEPILRAVTTRKVGMLIHHVSLMTDQQT